MKKLPFLTRTEPGREASVAGDRFLIEGSEREGDFRGGALGDGDVDLLYEKVGARDGPGHLDRALSGEDPVDRDEIVAVPLAVDPNRIVAFSRPRSRTRPRRNRYDARRAPRSPQGSNVRTRDTRPESPFPRSVF